MSTHQRKRKCKICKKWYQPDPRASNHQKSCKELLCRKKRQQQAQKRWMKKNPGYFKGRYENTRKWIKKHPGYLKIYRRNHPEYVEKNRNQQRQRRAKDMSNSQCVDIQDGIVMQHVGNIKDKSSLIDVDIQDRMQLQLIEPVYIRDTLRSVDIQDNIFKRPLSRYTSGRIITRKFLQELIKEFKHVR
jgi:hypothetical protein